MGYEEVIPSIHMVRTVNQAVEEINIDWLLGQYVEGGDLWKWNLAWGHQTKYGIP